MTEVTPPLAVTLPTTRGIEVLRAPPGSGKSRSARQEIARRFQDGTLHRVIWAVHSTRGDDSLGAEAAAHFSELGVRSTRVKGVRWVSRRTYIQNLQWSSEPEVKIVSFAHLPHLYDRSQRLNALAAEVLVIDECPMSGMMHTARLAPGILGALAVAGSAIASRLLDLTMARMTQADCPYSVQVAGDPRATYHNRYLTGSAVLQALSGAVTERDWTELGTAISTLPGRPVQFLDDWIETFKADVAQPDAGSTRFGVTWTHSAKRGNTDIFFYSSILTPLRNLPPTLVLDAYADQAVYRALFPGERVTIRAVGTIPPLRVEVNPRLRLHGHQLSRKSAHGHRVNIAEEVLRLQGVEGVPVSILADKAMHEAGSSWDAALKEAAGYLGVPNLPATLHHHAGRGKNSHAGHIIMSLTPPSLPDSHRVIDLAALFPTSARQRSRAHRALLRAEQLQMIHRGRQAQTGARIITAYQPDLPEHLCTTRTYQTLNHFTRGSTTPRWGTAVQTIAQELLAVLDGVPMSMLGALGLIKIKFTSDDARAMHLAALRRALTLSPPRPGTQLAAWLAHPAGELPRFKAVGARRRNDDRKSELLTGLGLVKLGQTYTVYHAGQRGGTVVWAQEGTDVDAVLNAAYDFQRP